MLLNLLCTFAILMALLLGWIKVQAAARRVALEHPETGPFQLVGGGCGGHGHGDARDQAGARPEPAAATAPATPVIRITSAGRAAPEQRETSGGCDSCDNSACKAAAGIGP
jgi:hypothetical protein